MQQKKHSTLTSINSQLSTKLVEMKTNHLNDQQKEDLIMDSENLLNSYISLYFQNDKVIKKDFITISSKSQENLDSKQRLLMNKASSKVKSQKEDKENNYIMKSSQQNKNQQEQCTIMKDNMTDSIFQLIQQKYKLNDGLHHMMNSQEYQLEEEQPRQMTQPQPLPLQELKESLQNIQPKKNEIPPKQKNTRLNHMLNKQEKSKTPSQTKTDVKSQSFSSNSKNVVLFMGEKGAVGFAQTNFSMNDSRTADKPKKQEKNPAMDSFEKIENKIKLSAKKDVSNNRKNFLAINKSQTQRSKSPNIQKSSDRFTFKKDDNLLVKELSPLPKKANCVIAKSPISKIRDYQKASYFQSKQQIDCGLNKQNENNYISFKDQPKEIKNQQQFRVENYESNFRKFDLNNYETDKNEQFQIVPEELTEENKKSSGNYMNENSLSFSFTKDIIDFTSSMKGGVLEKQKDYQMHNYFSNFNSNKQRFNAFFTFSKLNESTKSEILSFLTYQDCVNFFISNKKIAKFFIQNKISTHNQYYLQEEKRIASFQQNEAQSYTSAQYHDFNMLEISEKIIKQVAQKNNQDIFSLLSSKLVQSDIDQIFKDQLLQKIIMIILILTNQFRYYSSYLFNLLFVVFLKLYKYMSIQLIVYKLLNKFFSSLRISINTKEITCDDTSFFQNYSLGTLVEKICHDISFHEKNIQILKMLYNDDDFDQIKRKVQVSRKVNSIIFFLHKLVIKCLSHAGVIKIPNEVQVQKEQEFIMKLKNSQLQCKAYLKKFETIRAIVGI